MRESLITSAELSQEFEAFSPKKISKLLVEAQCDGEKGGRYFLWVGSQAREIIRAYMDREMLKTGKGKKSDLKRLMQRNGSGVGQTTDLPYDPLSCSAQAQTERFPGSLEAFRTVAREHQQHIETFWG